MPATQYRHTQHMDNDIFHSRITIARIFKYQLPNTGIHNIWIIISFIQEFRRSLMRTYGLAVRALRPFQRGADSNPATLKFLYVYKKSI